VEPLAVVAADSAAGITVVVVVVVDVGDVVDGDDVASIVFCCFTPATEYYNAVLALFGLEPAHCANSVVGERLILLQRRLNPAELREGSPVIYLLLAFVEALVVCCRPPSAHSRADLTHGLRALSCASISVLRYSS